MKRNKMKLKVYTFNKHLQRLPPQHCSDYGDWQFKRVVVATTSWKRVAELTDMDVRHFIKYGFVTANTAEIDHCMKHPEVLFYEHDNALYPVKI